MKAEDLKNTTGFRRGILITCEHGGNRVPAEFRGLFAPHHELLASHRGYDIGALSIAKKLSSALDAPLLFETVSRLVIDQNRSRRSRSLFSKISREFLPDEKTRLLDEIYAPYQARVRQRISAHLQKRSRTIHLAIHSFTPELDGKVRNADVGILFDPSRACEKIFAVQLKKELVQKVPDLRVRFNYPYRGASDGLTTALRKELKPKEYLGIEIELNHGLYLSKSPRWKQIGRELPEAVGKALFFKNEALE
jgi:predicted N-formylglutamate amidohydrolase